MGGCENGVGACRPMGGTPLSKTITILCVAQVTPDPGNAGHHVVMMKGAPEVQCSLDHNYPAANPSCFHGTKMYKDSMALPLLVISPAKAPLWSEIIVCHCSHHPRSSAPHAV